MGILLIYYHSLLISELVTKSLTDWLKKYQRHLQCLALIIRTQTTIICDLLTVLCTMESLLLSTSCILCFCVFLWLFARRYFREKYLCSAGKHVLVTGCSSGFGKEIAVTLDRLGFTVFATCRSVKAASEVKAICSERLQVLNLDVTCGEQIRDALKKVKGLLPAGKGRFKNKLF